MRGRLGASGPGRNLLRPRAGGRAASVIEIVLRPGRYRAVAGSASALGAGIQPRVLRRAPRHRRARDRWSRLGAVDARADPRPLQGTAQTHLAGPRVVGAAADTFDRRAIRRPRPAPEP